MASIIQSSNGGSSSGTQGYCGTLMAKIQVPSDLNSCNYLLSLATKNPGWLTERHLILFILKHKIFLYEPICIRWNILRSSLLPSCLPITTPSEMSATPKPPNTISELMAPIFMPQIPISLPSSRLVEMTANSTFPLKSPTDISDLHNPNNTLHFPPRIWSFFVFYPNKWHLYSPRSSIQKLYSYLDSSPCLALNI